jgi:coenzyme F420-0:L-glutamate ligase/coenzyme F420-1:gamma-L-glutamate ligase
MTGPVVSLIALDDLPLVEAGDDLAAMLIAAVRRKNIAPVDHDILVVAQKIVSKAEGRMVRLADVKPSPRAAAIADEIGKDSRQVELVLSEGTEIVRRAPNLLIVEHHSGFVMANAGIDQSNVGGDGEHALLLPRDADASAAALKAALDREFGVDLGVLINDSFGRPWRKGVVGVAIGAAGVPSLVSLVGKPDLMGRKLRVTEVAFADELAAAASLIMGQGDEGRPAVYIRGVGYDGPPMPACAIARPKETDLFR